MLTIIPVSAVRRDQPRWWCYSKAEADTLLRGAGSLLTVTDLHLEPPSKHGAMFAIVVAEAKD